MKKRIVSYNILNQRCLDIFYYKHSKVSSEYLEYNYRLYMLKNKLKTEIQLNSIICLQEVSKGIL